MPGATGALPEPGAQGIAVAIALPPPRGCSRRATLRALTWSHVDGWVVVSKIDHASAIEPLGGGGELPPVQAPMSASMAVASSTSPRPLKPSTWYGFQRLAVFVSMHMFVEPPVSG